MNEQKNFFDMRTLLAVLMVIIVWSGWNSYMRTKYPPPVKPEVTQAPATNQNTPEAQAPLNEKAATAAAPTGMKEDLLKYDSPLLTFELSSNGMGLRNIILKQFLDRKNEAVSIGSGSGVLPFESRIKGSSEPLRFSISQPEPNKFLGVATSGSATITKTIRIDSENYTLHTDIEVKGQVPGLTNYVSEDSTPLDIPGKNLTDVVDKWLSFSVLQGGKNVREYPSSSEAFSETYPKATVSALGSRYFAMATIDDSSVIPEFQAVHDTSKKTFVGSVDYPMLAGTNELIIRNKNFVGPKSSEIVRRVDKRLEGLIDFGMFSWLAYPMLDLLKWFYSLVHNYGFAIILLTILVRMIVLPFHMMSYRSMKAMQAIQPHIAYLKEKHKDDREALNREMMTFMREKKINPLGGCLPMLLQLPVFFALYQLLNETIELYRAPFIFWIQDLSLKDHFYVLPVLMGVAMYYQQKLTPTTMDPAQAKVMQFMPVIFSLMMISLPSGLTLYIFISTLFGIIQQLIIMKDRSVETSAVTA